jgi:D-galactose 1-dehydrogenase
MAQPIRLALVGLGKIARAEHLPAIAGNHGFHLAATVSPEKSGIPGTPHATSLDALLADGPELDGVILCTPPQVRYALARQALRRGLHVLLEKPPCMTLGEGEALGALAQETGPSLFASWHSRFAPAVEPARRWLAGRRIERVSITWREDVREWHPGQRWIWEPGGLGVFDPGINALSILTHLLPRPIVLTDAALSIPANRAMPIAADLAFRAPSGAEIRMELDWRQSGPQRWDIAIETESGVLALTKGGAALTLPSGIEEWPAREYPALYDHFASLIRERRSDMDIEPLRLVADAFRTGRRDLVEAFHD